MVRKWEATLARAKRYGNENSIWPAPKLSVEIANVELIDYIFFAVFRGTEASHTRIQMSCFEGTTTATSIEESPKLFCQRETHGILNSLEHKMPPKMFTF